jgi:hypothetical protein
MRKLNQDGVAHLGLIIVLILAVAVVAFAFWRIQTSDDEADTGEPTTSEVDETEPIEDASELEAIEQELEATDIDGDLDVEELDATIE